MINICIIFNNGEYTTLKFNGTLAQAQDYYLNREILVDERGNITKVDAVTEIKE